MPPSASFGVQALPLSLKFATSGAPVAFAQGTATIRNDDPYKTLIYFNSVGGDYIGGGRRFTLTEADGTITASSYGSGVHVGFDGSTWSVIASASYPAAAARDATSAGISSPSLKRV